MLDLTKKRITVTGGKGFLGTHFVRELKEERKCPNVMIADLPEYDLRKLDDIKKLTQIMVDFDLEAKGIKPLGDGKKLIEEKRLNWSISAKKNQQRYFQL